MSTSTLTVGDAIKNRGSLHVLSADVDIPDARIQDIVRDAILYSPSAFNGQSGRAVVLLKEEHKKFWDMALEVAKATVAPPVFEKAFGPRIKMFREAYGTVSFR
jgi:predicted oxidoreductase (fatty acid repression mutant protein)